MFSGVAVPVVTLATSAALASSFFLEYKVKYAMLRTTTKPPMAILAGLCGMFLV